MKILITGVPGTGKSTISKALNEKGIFSLDFSDVPGLCAWWNKKTNKKVEISPITDPKWYNEHKRICDIKKLKEILDHREDIVITGVASGNHTEYLPLFDKLILLQCSPETFTHRMETRTKPYGKTKVERDDAIEWQKHFDPKLLEYGAISINTEGDIETVVEKIIPQLN